MGDADELDGYEPDKLGEWSERKIAIVSKYAAAYANILVGQGLKHFYIDGFAGGPIALRKETGEQIATTARRILEIDPRSQAIISSTPMPARLQPWHLPALAVRRRG